MEACDVIFGGKANALGIARALNGAASRIELVHLEERPPAACSRYVARATKYDPTQADISTFLRSACTTPAILYPTSDYWLEQLVDALADLPADRFLLFRNSPKVLSSFLDKLEFYRHFADRFPIPETVEWRENGREGFVTKPRRAFHGTTCIPKGFSRPRPDTPSELLVQQRFIQAPLHDHYSVCGVAAAGRIAACLLTRKLLEHPSPGGTATLVALVDDIETGSRLRTLCEDFIAATSYSGPFELEIVAEGRQLWVIEFNARFWLQHTLGLKCGINFPLLYRSLLLGTDVLVREIRPSLKAVWIHEVAPVSLLKTDSRQAASALRAIWRSQVREFAHFSFDDPRPLLQVLKCSA